MMNEDYIGLDGILSLLGKHRKSGKGYMAHCPVHEDKNPSLSITEKDGQILLYCHADCAYEDVCSSLGIEPSQLFKYLPDSFGANNDPEYVYRYEDEDGSPLFEVLRFLGKEFRCRQPKSNGEWKYNLRGVKRVPYRLPELIELKESGGGTVYICEGEKDVDTLRKLGLTATCNPHGALKWKGEYRQYFEGLDCVILPDNDTSGMKHAEQVARSVSKVAKSTKIVELPDLFEGGDVTDWLKMGHNVGDVKGLIEKAPIWQPDKISTENNNEFELKKIDDFLLEEDDPTQYIVEGLLPTSAWSILAAKPKVGKSTTARSIAYSVSVGKPFLGREVEKGTVLYFNFEEKPYEIRRQFAEMKSEFGEMFVYVGPPPNNVLLELISAIKNYKPDLVIIDPLSRMIRAPDFNDYAAMTKALEPIVDIARKYNTHIMALHHERKHNGGGGDSVLGSTALFGIIDTLITMKRKGNSRSIWSINRYGTELPETIIVLDTKGLTISEGEVAAIKLAEFDEQVLEFILGEEALTETQIKNNFNGVPKGEISKSLRRLVKHGKLVRTGAGVKGDPYLYSRPRRDQNMLDHLPEPE